jgi:hypothetical protein
MYPPSFVLSSLAKLKASKFRVFVIGGFFKLFRSSSFNSLVEHQASRIQSPFSAFPIIPPFHCSIIPACLFLPLNNFALDALGSQGALLLFRVLFSIESS